MVGKDRIQVVAASNLWEFNTPENFWRLLSHYSPEIWEEAIKNAAEYIGLKDFPGEIEMLLPNILGEARFGPGHWELGLAKRAYYTLKPYIPRQLTRIIRRVYHHNLEENPKLNWPIDDRYVSFLWKVVQQLIIKSDKQSVNYVRLWPENHQFALVLTHDVETAGGLEFVREIADMEERLGFRSSFNFVLERYSLDLNLLHELKQRGFEVGCHGLKHDGKLYNSKLQFEKKAARINSLMKDLGMVGFRSPLTHRNPAWMQALEIEYDSSFFDTDPFEPIPGGTMSIWPFFIGHFVELPYTLVQDYTLTDVLGEVTPRFWLEKVKYIRGYHGMALINTHPDYMKGKKPGRKIYWEFLNRVKETGDYWQPLPKDIANWWRLRSSIEDEKLHRSKSHPIISIGEISLENMSIKLS